MKKLLLLLCVTLIFSCGEKKEENKDNEKENNIVTDNMIDNRYTGKGTHISTSGLFKGNKYVGEWKDGKFHGSGSYIFNNQDGDTYVGEYRDGKQNGKGIYTWASGGKYTGDFKDNKMHGYGTFIRDNIGEYVGEFKEGVFHGQGTYTLSNGEIVNGPWNNGTPGLPVIGFGQQTFNVINNPKSKGLNFSISEPAEFERIDGKRPNILYNWLKNRDNLTTRVTISISIAELPDEMKLAKEEWIQYLKFDSGVKDLTSGANNVNQEKYIVLESYPGVMFNSTKQIQRIDLERKTYNKTVLLFVEGKGFTINMSVSTKSSLEINEGIFMSMINSIVFPDQYN